MEEVVIQEVKVVAELVVGRSGWLLPYAELVVAAVRSSSVDVVEN